MEGVKAGGSAVSIPYWSDFNEVPGADRGHRCCFNPILVRFQRRRRRPRGPQEARFNPILVRFQRSAPDGARFGDPKCLVSIPYWSDFNGGGEGRGGGAHARFQSHIGPISTRLTNLEPSDLAGLPREVSIPYWSDFNLGDLDLAAIVRSEERFNPILVRFQLVRFQRYNCLRGDRPPHVSIPYWSDFNGQRSTCWRFRAASGFNPILVRFQRT